MEAERFDTLVRSLITTRSRRAALRTGITTLAASIVAALGLGAAPELDAKKNKKKKKKKVTLCHFGQTITVKKKGSKAHFAHGDTAGPCPPIVTSSCPAGTTRCAPGLCCVLGNTCCAGGFCCNPGFTVCCADGLGCCPTGSQCCPGSGCCLTNQVCCPGGGCCPAGTVCSGGLCV